MVKQYGLTPREFEVAKVLAYGAAKKEVPDYLSGSKKVSVFTVDNILKKIYRKLKVQSLNALSAWFFVNVKGAGTDGCPERLRKRIASGAMLLILVIGMLNNTCNDMRRPLRTRTGTSPVRVLGGRARGRSKTYEF